MKNKFKLILGIFLFVSTSSKAIPNGGWKCSWNNDRSWSLGEMHGDVQLCNFGQSMTCKHWLWGTNTSSYSWTRPCNFNGSTQNPGDPGFPTDEEMDDQNKFIRYIAQHMAAIQLSGVSVPDSYCNEDSLLNETILNNAIEYRHELAGYDISNWPENDTCYVPVITLEVIVPSYSEPDINFACITASPNPVSSILSVSFGTANSLIDKIQLIDVPSGNVIFQKLAPIQTVELIDVSSYINGLHKLVIFKNEEIHYISILIE